MEHHTGRGVLQIIIVQLRHHSVILYDIISVSSSYSSVEMLWCE